MELWRGIREGSSSMPSGGFPKTGKACLLAVSFGMREMIYNLRSGFSADHFRERLRSILILRKNITKGYERGGENLLAFRGKFWYLKLLLPKSLLLTGFYYLNNTFHGDHSSVG